MKTINKKIENIDEISFILGAMLIAIISFGSLLNILQ
jgi:hypothetical protein